MLKISIPIIILLALFFPSRAAELAESNRVVLAMPQQFDKIVTNGNLTVEVIFRSDYKGYVVYNTEDTVAPRVHCVVDENRTLHLSGNVESNSVKSRVVVLACDSVVSVVNNEAGTILIKQIPRVEDFCAVSNGTGAIKCEELGAHHLMLMSSGSASMTIGTAKARFIDIYGNGDGEISLGAMLCHGARILNNADGSIAVKGLKSRRGEILDNAGGRISVSGKASAFAVVNYSTGTIDISGFRCKKLSEANYGSGLIIK
ncbi:MAG: DUF2807 domain-containing protein [Muribaculaceae bacterium]|nr:DUF2807 domain-containing protein [Muribaculaceae bacterium]